MSRFAVHTAGESHGGGIVALIEGVPFGLSLDSGAIDAELARRQQGFGRSSRMKLERDRIEVLAGLYHGKTSGAPLLLRVANVDRSLDRLPPVHRPRPGHADLAGALRFATDDARPVLERASARETAARVAAGAVAKQVLSRIGVSVAAFVVAIGESRRAVVPCDPSEFENAIRRRDASDVACSEAAIAVEMRDAIRAAGAAGDTLGGVVEAVATGVPAGLGSLEQWWTRLDARLAAALISIPSAKGVEIGDGFESASRRGSSVHDSIVPGKPDSRRPARPTNCAGGVEGGMSNGQPIVARIAFKPLSTLVSPLPTIDLRTGQVAEPDPQRSDVCAVPAAAVVCEAMLAIALLDAARERFGGPTIDDFTAAVTAECERGRRS